MKRVLFLYSELAGYLFSCLEELASRGVEVTVVHWPVNPEAPFKIPAIQGVEFVSRSSMETEQLRDKVQELKPDIILVSGWLDKEYLNIAKRERNRVNTVILFDTQWSGSLKQRIMTLAGKRFLRSRFSHAWVAGASQRDYALKLGFSSDKVSTGFYSADLNRFNILNEKRNNKLTKDIPKTILYVGRYIAVKNLDLLWSAFIKANEKTSGHWRLKCIGTGEMFSKRFIHKDIEHVGFVQPADLESHLLEASVFVLPSLFEPWGVVVHEFAAAGFPLLLSDKVGAASEFLENGRNGFSFDASSELELVSALSSVMSLDEEVLRNFGHLSHVLAQRLNPKVWTDRLLGML